MDALLQPPAATPLDLVASQLSLLVYLGVALGVLVAHPRDVRARTFLALAVASAVPYAVTAIQAMRGPGVYTPPVMGLMAAAFAVGCAALFHFTQIFPARRPWIRAHGRLVIALYIVPVLPVALLAWLIGGLMLAMSAGDAGGLGAVSPGVSAVLLLTGIVPIFFVGVVLPFAGLMSLVNSWREAKTRADEPARVTTLWMLISQLAGGVLAVLVLPMLHMIGIGPPWSTAIAACVYGFSLLMPLTFAMAVWKYRLLDVSTSAE
jgi:hypothetical protein